MPDQGKPGRMLQEAAEADRLMTVAALLEFDGGYMGFERVVDPKTGKQYLRAFIHSKSRGLTTSSPVELSKVFEFASGAVKQTLLADGHSEIEIGDVRWQSNLPH